MINLTCVKSTLKFQMLVLCRKYETCQCCQSQWRFLYTIHFCCHSIHEDQLVRNHLRQAQAHHQKKGISSYVLLYEPYGREEKKENLMKLNEEKKKGKLQTNMTNWISYVSKYFNFYIKIFWYNPTWINKEAKNIAFKFVAKGKNQETLNKVIFSTCLCFL